MKKENKKGFWRSLFTPKPCACTPEINQLIAQEQQKQECLKEEQPQPVEDKNSCPCSKKTKN